jgi:8-oxo-dGTP pyrophosphatase MutT (NUDIX family)
MSIYALDEQFIPSLADALVVHDADAPIDEELRRRGTPHLEEVLARSSGTFDGPILALERVERGQIHAVRAGYFDMIATCDSLAGDPELRELAERLAAPDPLRIGTGRAAAIGVSAIAVRRGRFTLGRRAPHLPLDPDRWHVVPSGTVDSSGLVETLASELREEHGIDQASGLRVIGVGYDLWRLRPEIAVMTDDLGDVPAPEPSDEFVEFREFELDLAAMARVWELELTPAAAVAVAALERELQG